MWPHSYLNGPRRDLAGSVITSHRCSRKLPLQTVRNGRLNIRRITYASVRLKILKSRIEAVRYGSLAQALLPSHMSVGTGMPEGVTG